MNDSRKVVDCREMPSDSHCTLTIAGTEDEVMKAAVEHACSSHGHVDTPELRKELHSMMHDEMVGA